MSIHPAAELFALSPEEFTGRRNEIVRQLKKAGDRETAAAVGALRKPAIHLWAVNHLARERTLAVTRLLSAAASLAEAQQLALSGEADARTRLRQDSGEYQRALDLAVREATALLRDAGRGATEDTARRVREILAGAALGDVELRGQLASGSLSAAPSAPGLGAFGAGGSSGGPPRIAIQQQPKPAAAARATGEGRPGPVATPASTSDRRARHLARLQARQAAEGAAATAKRLAEVARRARRRAAVAAASAASAEAEASQAEARLEAARLEAERADAFYQGLQNPG